MYRQDPPFEDRATHWARTGTVGRDALLHPVAAHGPLFDERSAFDAVAVPADASALPRLLVRLCAVHSHRERRAIVEQEVRDLGFDDMTYGRISMVHGEAVATRLAVCIGNRHWVRHYMSRRFDLVDPRLHLAMRSNLPFRWDLASLSRDASAGRAGADFGRFLQALADAGVCSGVMLPMPGLVNGQRSMVSFVSAARAMRPPDDAHTARMYMLALSLHEFQCRRDAQEPTPPAVRLTGRQDQILRGLARGLSDREIASALNLSLHGVDYHLRRLRECFKAHNRVELLQAAVRCGVR